MPNGAKPAGIVLSVNDFTRLKFPSYTSTLLLALSAAYSEFPEVWLVIASPVYDAPACRTPIKALFGEKLDQPLIVPSSVANKNTDVQVSILNSVDPL